MGGRSAAAGEAAVCLLLIVSCRSLAIARSLLLFGSSCGAVPIAPWRAICLGCLAATGFSTARFFVKAFQWVRYLRIPCLIISSSRAAVIPSFRHPIFPALLLARFSSARSRRHLVILTMLLACRLASRPFVPLSPG